MSEQDYQAGLELLRRTAPQHALLPQLSRGFTHMNTIYLRHALDGTVAQVKQAGPQVRRSGEAVEQLPDSEEYRQLQTKKSTLYGRRAKLSNQFHDHEGDATACANLSDDIRRVQLKIKAVQRQTAHYLRTGELSDDHAPREERQYEGLALQRKYNTTRQNCNRWRRRIQTEGPTADPIDLRRWEKILRDYENEFESLAGQIRQAAL